MKIKKEEGSRGQVYYTASINYQLDADQYEKLQAIKKVLDKRGRESRLEGVFEAAMIAGAKYDIDMKLNILSWQFGLMSDEEFWAAKEKYRLSK